MLERQALALTVAIFEGELPSLIHEISHRLLASMNARVRRETREERAARPRNFADAPLTDTLRSIGAERFRVKAGYHVAQDVIRFRDPNRRSALLSYFWREQPRVRSLLVDWIKGSVGDAEMAGLTRKMGRALTHIAQIDLPGLEYEVLGRWTHPPFYEVELWSASELLAASWNVHANRSLIRKIVLRLAEGGSGDLATDHVAREAAAIVALGALGERSPALAVEMLRRLAPHLRVGRRGNDPLRRRLLASPLMRGDKAATE